MKTIESRIGLAPIIVGLAGALCAGAAGADTILFPVISYNVPNVTTVISVINGRGSKSSHLHYIYRYKETAELDVTCGSVSFTRASKEGDIVSFDPSGTFGSGNALFGDTNDYDGSFAMGVKGPLRAYLLVTNSGAAGDRVNVDDTTRLGGEAVSMDIATGAAWGMKAINDETREDYTFVSHDDGGGVWSALPSNGYNSRRLPFFPPTDWKTRMFVTPIGADMNTANHTATVGLVSGDPGNGVIDRQGTVFNFTPIDRQVTCTAGVDLSTLVDSTVWSAVENVGGWTWFAVKSGDAVVYKLEFSTNASLYGGTVNNGLLFSTYALP